MVFQKDSWTWSFIRLKYYTVCRTSFGDLSRARLEKYGEDTTTSINVVPAVAKWWYEGKWCGVTSEKVWMGLPVSDKRWLIKVSNRAGETTEPWKSLPFFELSPSHVIAIRKYVRINSVWTCPFFTWLACCKGNQCTLHCVTPAVPLQDGLRFKPLWMGTEHVSEMDNRLWPTPSTGTGMLQLGQIGKPNR